MPSSSGPNTWGGGASTHINIARSEWASLQAILRSGTPVEVDGHGLEISDVVAVCL
jgi:hypothetical protein